MMCLGVPGKIVRIEGDVATVDYEIEQRQGKIIEQDFKEGDYVLIQGGILILKIEKEEAKRALSLYKKAVSEACEQ